MIKTINSLIDFLKTKTMLRQVSYWAIIILFALYVFSIPSFSGRAKWNLISYALMGLFLALVIFYTTVYSKWSFNKKLLIPSLFVGVAFLGTTFYSHSFIGTSGKIGWTSLVLMLLTLFSFYYAFVIINNPTLILKIIVLAFFAFAIYFTIIYRSSIIRFQINSSRLGGYFDGINAIGFYFSLNFVFSLYLGLFFKKKRELLYLATAIVFLFLGLFTGSRAFLVCSLIGTIVVTFVRLRKRLLLFFIILGVLVALILILVNIPQLAYLKDQLDRALYTLFGIGNSKLDTSTIQRVLWPRYAFYLASKNLIFGLGVEGFGEFSGIGTYAHNNFAEVICDFGIIGFVLYYLAFLYPLILSVNKGGEKRIIQIIVFLYIIRSFFGIIYYSKESYLALAFCFYLTKDYSIKDIVIINKRKEQSEVYYELAI